MTLAIAESSSGAASAASTNEAMASGVAGSSSILPLISSTACRRNWKRATTPKFPPPPRIAQNRSGFVSVSARTVSRGAR